MFANRFTRRIAATALVAGLALGGFAGIGAMATADDHGDAPTEEAGSTWSRPIHYSPQGSTWS